MSFDGKNPFHGSTRFVGKKIHLGVTGSVAAYKSLDLLRNFLKLQIRVSACLTAAAEKFVSPLLFRSLGAEPSYGPLFSDADVFAHLRPGQEADAMLVAPATANFMAKAARGLADDMLSAQILAFSGPKVFAPAMNPRMWENPATTQNARILKERACAIVEPATGASACGETGQGKLADLQEIFLATLKALAPADMASLKVMATIGPSREMWDGARFFSNASSGKMGCALATCAWLRGAEVCAICGPGVDIYLPSEIRRVNVESAVDMFEAAKKIWPQMDWGIFCAAVADFAPARPENADDVKLKKTDFADSFEITMKRNPDILASLAATRSANQKVLGFAAEITPDLAGLAPLAYKKLQGKKADLLAANRINAGDGSFGASTSSMLAVDKNGLEESWTAMGKADLAWELCSWLLRL